MITKIKKFVSDIYTAINDNKKIRFKYYKWDIEKKLVARHNGDWFVVSSWALTWDDENYYMVAFDDLDHKIKHYRVDKMMRMSVEDEMREGKEAFKNFDMAAYSKATFGMYSGKKTRIHIRFPNNMCGVFIDRFGKEITFRKVDKGHSMLAVDVAVSHQFFGWIFSLGREVKVTGPDEVVEQMRIAAEEFAGNYQ